jgi:glycosyltransferase involved in cell wall biosynthesis
VTIDGEARPPPPRPLRICYISDERYPSRWTDTQQVMKTATALAREPVTVDLVLPRVWNTLWANNRARRGVLEGYYGVEAAFELTQIPSVPPSRWRVEKLTHGLLAPLYAAIEGHDLVYTRDVLAVLAALSLGKYAMFEGHRVLVRHHRITHAMIQAVRRRRRFLGVVTNAAFIADSYREMGFEPERVIVAHNCYDPRDMQPRLTQVEARARLGLGADAKIVCYSGHIQKRKGIETIVQMAARTPELAYLICGGFPDDVAEARRLAEAAGAKNLTFTGWIDVADLAPYLYAADVLLIPPTSVPLQRHGNTVLPIKTYSYLAAGRVIVAPRLPDVVEVLHDGENALLVTPDDLDDAVAVVRRALAEPGLAARLGARAEADAPLYTWQARAAQLHRFMKERLAAAGG